MMMKCGRKPKAMLKEVIDEMGVEYYEAEGEAAFYGPKLDVQVKTALRKRRNSFNRSIRLLTS